MGKYLIIKGADFSEVSTGTLKQRLFSLEDCEALKDVSGNQFTDYTAGGTPLMQVNDTYCGKTIKGITVLSGTRGIATFTLVRGTIGSTFQTVQEIIVPQAVEDNTFIDIDLQNLITLGQNEYLGILSAATPSEPSVKLVYNKNGLQIGGVYSLTQLSTGGEVLDTMFILNPYWIGDNNI